VVSFTAVIERTPALRWLDMLGRRPAAGPGQSETGGTGDAGGVPAVGDPAANGGRRTPAARGAPGTGPAAGGASP